MSRPIRISRRQAVRGLLATTAFGVATKLSGCSPASEGEASSAADSGSEGEVVVGFIYVGPKDDFGYNQAHAEGAQAMAAVPGIRIIEEANVPETSAVLETMRSMIEIDGATVIFPYFVWLL